MNAEVYAEWLRRQGNRVVRTASSYWHSAGFHVYQAFPHHWLIKPDARELRALISQSHAVALRYSLPAAAGAGVASHHVAYMGRSYGFENLGTRVRKNVRRSLRECSIGTLSMERFATEGWPLRVDTLRRQRRRMNESEGDWRRRFLAAAGLPGFEVWSAQVRGQLAATMVVFQMDDWRYVLHQQCHSDFLKEMVNNALTFTVTSDLVARGGVNGIFYGLESLDAAPGVDAFKWHMGYEPRPVRQRVMFHPYLAPLVHRGTHALLQGVRSFRPRSRWAAKAEGIFRLALRETQATAPPVSPVYHVGAE